MEEDGFGRRGVDLGTEGAAQGEVANGETENREAGHDENGADKPCEPGGCREGGGKPEEAHDGDGECAVHEHYCEESDPDGWRAAGHDAIDGASRARTLHYRGGALHALPAA